VCNSRPRRICILYGANKPRTLECRVTARSAVFVFFAIGPVLGTGCWARAIRPAFFLARFKANVERRQTFNVDFGQHVCGLIIIPILDPNLGGSARSTETAAGSSRFMDRRSIGLVLRRNLG